MYGAFKWVSWGSKSLADVHYSSRYIYHIATMALTVPILFSYKLHAFFQIIKLFVSVWNGGSFLLEVLPGQAILMAKK
jgi:hypothetical protein